MLTGHTSGHLRLGDFGSNWGMLYKKGHEMTAPLYANLFLVLESMHKTASKHGAVFVFVYFPVASRSSRAIGGDSIPFGIWIPTISTSTSKPRR